jgi:hypothetical protein
MALAARARLESENFFCFYCKPRSPNNGDDFLMFSKGDI